MKNFKGGKTWGVLGKQKTYYPPTHFMGEKKPLNDNPLNSWDYKKSNYRRIDGRPADAQQGGVVPQVSPTPDVSPTPTGTPEVTPTPTPTIPPPLVYVLIPNQGILTAMNTDDGVNFYINNYQPFQYAGWIGFAKNDYNNQFQMTTFPNGTAVQSYDFNCLIPGGTYNITYNINTDEYTIDGTSYIVSNSLDFNTQSYNSINFTCDGNPLGTCYGTTQTNINDLVDMFNQSPPVQPNACFLDYGTYEVVPYDPTSVRLRIPVSQLDNICNPNPNSYNLYLGMEIFYD